MGRILDLLFSDFYEIAEPQAAEDAARAEMATLEPAIRAILEARDQGATQGDIARATGLSASKVRQLEAKGLRLLRHPKRGILQAGRGQPSR